MRNGSGHQCKVKMSCSEKQVNENTYGISSIKRRTQKFLEVSPCKTTAKKCTKKVCCTCKVEFF